MCCNRNYRFLQKLAVIVWSLEMIRCFLGFNKMTECYSRIEIVVEKEEFRCLSIFSPNSRNHFVIPIFPNYRVASLLWIESHRFEQIEERRLARVQSHRNAETLARQPAWMNECRTWQRWIYWELTGTRFASRAAGPRRAVCGATWIHRQGRLPSLPAKEWNFGIIAETAEGQT